jgi:hypothetical protein
MNTKNPSEENCMNARTPVETKKPYQAPVLSEYGDIRMITQTVPSGNGSLDGGGGSHKTHV